MSDRRVDSDRHDRHMTSSSASFDIEREGIPLAVGASNARPWWKALPYMVKGDFDAYIVVFSNNVATMLIGVGLVADKIGIKRTYDSVVPAVAVSMVFGCIFKSVQAQFLAASTGRTDVCSQPFGINTPGIFAFSFGIIYPVYYGAGGGRGKDAAEEESAQNLAWQVGVLANVVQGLIEMSLSFVGPMIANLVPKVALLGSLASIGLAFLFTGSFVGEVSAPVVGLLPFFVIILAMYADVKFPKIPSMFVPVLLGSAAAWITQQPWVTSTGAVREGMKQVGWHPASFATEAFDNFGEVSRFIPVVFPVALTVSVATIQCREVAARAGDSYNLRVSMLSDGLATILAACFGCPFGMTTFIGHPGFKAMGAKIGYNLLSAGSFVILCFSGMAVLFKALFPPQALNPILLFIGLAICCDALEVTPNRHWPALMVSLVPCFCNWGSSQAMSFAGEICKAQPKDSPCVIDPSGMTAWTLDKTGNLRGLYALGQGYLLSSIFLTSMLIFTIDRKFFTAAGWAAISAVSASCGLIHADKLFPPWTGPTRPADSDKVKHFDEQMFDLHLHFLTAYMSVCIMFLLLGILQRYGFVASALPGISSDPKCQGSVESDMVGFIENFPIEGLGCKDRSTMSLISNLSTTR